MAKVKVTKKFVPPLKASQKNNVDENNNSKPHKQGKVNRKKLVINFDYEKIKKQHVSKKATQRSIKSSQRKVQQHNCADGESSGEFVWFEPIQNDEKTSHDVPKCEGDESPNFELPDPDGAEVNSNLDADTAEDIYIFASSPIESNEQDPDCVMCCQEQKMVKKSQRNKTPKKEGKPARKKATKGQIKKSVKKQVLKSLFKMGEDMAKLREKEKVLLHGEMSR